MPLFPRSRRGTWLLAGAVWLAACAGLWWAFQKNEGNTPNAGRLVADVAPLRLELTAAPLQSREKVVVQLRVTNGGSSALAWDIRWAVFLNWEVLNNSNQPLVPEDTDSPLPTLVDKERYFSIDAGSSVSREFRLGQQIGQFARFKYVPDAVTASNAPPIPVTFAEEVISRFHFQPDVKSIRVSAKYEARFAIRSQFGRRFPYDPRHVDMWPGNCRSNVAVIALE
jgi:hypothetical protein